MKIVNGLVITVVALGSLALAGEEADKSAKKAPPEKQKTESVYQAAVPKKADKKAKVWTNAELEKLGNEPFATTPSSEAPATPGSAADPLKWLQERERSVQSRTERIALAQAELDAAEAKLANLQKQLLATVNPFSARPQLSEEETEERRMSGEDAKTRHDRTQKMADEARAEVEAAKANLQRAKAGR